jgi:PPOX class probable F420-dependent enzyme
MPTKQGDLTLLNDPVAQELLHSTIPARLAYVWRDGTPRVVPIWFHWNGTEVVLGTPLKAPKVQALAHNPKVVLTIDSAAWPYKVLQIRGTAQVETVQGVVPEYAAAAQRYFGEAQGRAWVEQVRTLFPRMARIAVRPEWVGILDFETRFPSAIAAAMSGT